MRDDRLVAILVLLDVVIRDVSCATDFRTNRLASVSVKCDQLERRPAEESARHLEASRRASSGACGA